MKNIRRNFDKTNNDLFGFLIKDGIIIMNSKIHLISENLKHFSYKIYHNIKSRNKNLLNFGFIFKFHKYNFSIFK